MYKRVAHPGIQTEENVFSVSRRKLLGFVSFSKVDFEQLRLLISISISLRRDGTRSITHLFLNIRSKDVLLAIHKVISNSDKRFVYRTLHITIYLHKIRDATRTIDIPFLYETIWNGIFVTEI